MTTELEPTQDELTAWQRGIADLQAEIEEKQIPALQNSTEMARKRALTIKLAALSPRPPLHLEHKSETPLIWDVLKNWLYCLQLRGFRPEMEDGLKPKWAWISGGSGLGKSKLSEEIIWHASRFVNGYDYEDDEGAQRYRVGKMVPAYYRHPATGGVNGHRWAEVAIIRWKDLRKAATANKGHYANLKESACHADILLLDDIDVSGKLADWELSDLGEIFEARACRDKKWTIITTNLTIENLLKLDARLHDRVMRSTTEKLIY